MGGAQAPGHQEYREFYAAFLESRFGTANFSAFFVLTNESDTAEYHQAAASIILAIARILALSHYASIIDIIQEST